MRNRLVMQRAVVWLILIVMWLGSSAMAQTIKEEQRTAKSTQESNLAARIERVEHGLLPPAVVKGETPGRMTLADRMKFYKTPGVSIAVINDGRIEWAG